jgi:lipoate-protein ligase A
MQEIQLLRLSGWSIWQQLQLEEALVRTDTRNWCILNTQAPPAIVMGISGQFDQLVNQDTFHKRPIPVVRRFSGGGTVVVDPQTLFITLICQHDSIGVHPYPDAIMQWTQSLYRHPIALKENDYVIGQQKCGGNAQYLRKERWLHHTTLLWDYCPELMSYLKIPEKRPTYRLDRPHDAFLCKLKDHLPSSESLFENFLQELASHFTLRPADTDELSTILQRPHRRATALLSAPHVR